MLTRPARLCTLCARGGSKGVPGKNIRPLLGKPLLAYSIEQAQSSGLFDHIAVSSDSQAILDIAHACGIDLLIRRPSALADDTAPKLPAIAHAADMAEQLSGLSFDIVVDLDVTAPARTPDAIVGAVTLLEQTAACNVISAHPSRRSPYFNMVEQAADGSVHLVKPPPLPITRRQDAPPTYDLNASIYVWQREWLRQHHTLFHERTRLYIMKETAPDIDSELDFILVEEWMKRRRVAGDGEG